MEHTRPKRFITRRRILSLVGISLFILAIWVLQNEIQQFSWSTFREHVRLIPYYKFPMALYATIAGYLILTFYDKLALISQGIRLPWYKAAKASFLGFAFSHNMTPSVLVGGTLRYRIYSGYGLSGFEVTRMVGFCAFTLWLGFMALGGFIFATTSIRLPDDLAWPLPDLRIVGWIFMLLVILYLILSRTVRSSIVIMGKVFSIPVFPVALGQIIIASADLVASSLVLYFLLPPIEGLTYPLFLAIYLLGFMGGIISQVPGGLGVIETILVLMLGSFVDPSAILSAVLVFRLYYFILPLLVASIILAIHEIKQRLSASSDENP